MKYIYPSFNLIFKQVPEKKNNNQLLIENSEMASYLFFDLGWQADLQQYLKSSTLLCMDES